MRTKAPTAAVKEIGQPRQPMAPAGYLSSYRPDCYPELAHNLALAGFDNETMANAFGVHVDTFIEWKKTYSEFAEAIREGGLNADGKVARAMYHRALGYDYQAEKLLVVNGEVIREEVRTHLPGDVAAQRVWLTNRRPDKWADRKQITGPNGGPIQQQVMVFDPVEAAKVYLKLMEDT